MKDFDIQSAVYLNHKSHAQVWRNKEDKHILKKITHIRQYENSFSAFDMKFILICNQVK